MTDSPSPWATALRRAYRAWRYGPIRVGHPLMRRLFQAMIAPQQIVALRSGVRMALDLRRDNQSTIFWLDGDIEPQLTWAIRTLVPVRGVFVDCGANNGLMGLLARGYRQARVVFVEPHPRLAAIVRANVALNHCGNECDVVEAAASDAPGEAQFFEHTSVDGSHSLHQEWVGAEGRALGKVRLTTLPAILDQLGVSRVDFLKIDTEGHDLAVLKGLGDRLSPSHIRMIYAEMTVDREEVARIMAAHGYVGFGHAKLPRRESTRRFRAFEAGGSECFFEPLNGQAMTENETLWCAPGSPEAQYLQGLAAARR